MRAELKVSRFQDDRHSGNSVTVLKVQNTHRQVLVNANSPNVCILNISLLDFGANELARQLRSRTETSDAVLVALAGCDHDRDREKATAAGSNYHFAKSVTPRELVTLLADMSRA